MVTGAETASTCPEALSAGAHSRPKRLLGRCDLAVWQADFFTESPQRHKPRLAEATRLQISGLSRYVWGSLDPVAEQRDRNMPRDRLVRSDPDKAVQRKATLGLRASPRGGSPEDALKLLRLGITQPYRRPSVHAQTSPVVYSHLTPGRHRPAAVQRNAIHSGC